MSLKSIPLQKIHEEMGAKMVPFAGFLMPVRYSSDLEEHLCIRQKVGVFDVSHMGEFIIEGEGALDLIQRVSANDASKLIDGKVQYSYLPNQTGGVVDDLLVYRMGEEKYMLVVNASNIDKDWDWISQFNVSNVKMTNISAETCLFALQGSKSVDVLSKLVDLEKVDLKSMEYYSFKISDIKEVKEVVISATGYTGAGGFELYVSSDQAETLWNLLFEAGKEYEILPIGLGARDTLRLEMGYCLYGNDITDETSPIAAGLGWVTKFTKDFTNSTSLFEQKKSGTSEKLVGLLMEDKGIPRSHYRIADEQGHEIGEITSGTISPVLNKGIALGYVMSEFATVGQIVFVKVRDKLLKAKIVKLPFVGKTV
ncbi:MAG: glycine cleavage system aminomethyltransferase GcvT [Spirosomataceae bacterium]